jgi:ribosomal protein S27AE
MVEKKRTLGVIEKKKYECDECGSIFVIEYDAENVEDEPQFCPYCATYISDMTREINDDE